MSTEHRIKIYNSKIVENVYQKQLHRESSVEPAYNPFYFISE